MTWQGDKMTVGYILYKDGQFAGILTEPSLTIAEDDNASYTVKAISRHGVTSMAKKVADPSKMLAFPTAEGFGKYTSGGRGGKVVKVTSLADDKDGITEGTLRWAFKQYPDEPITIVFAVSGEIKLVSDMRVKRNDWTLAGQTAPGEGIVITHNKMNFGGSQNFIIRNMRFRIGQNNASGTLVAEGAVATENCANYIFDHCTVGWSVEENMNTQDSHFLTVQNTMVHEGLYNAGHPKEPAAMAHSGAARRRHTITTSLHTTTAEARESTVHAATIMWSSWSMSTMSTTTTAARADATAARTQLM